jgi:queuine/archaeosine tRNA-ribosyltransferase
LDIAVAFTESTPPRTKKKYFRKSMDAPIIYVTKCQVANKARYQGTRHDMLLPKGGSTV